MDNLASYKEFLRNNKTESSESNISESSISWKEYFEQNMENTGRHSQSDYSEMAKK